MNNNRCKKLYYNSYMLGSEELQDIDNLISKGLEHIELENKRYSDMLVGKSDLINEAMNVLESVF